MSTHLNYWRRAFRSHDEHTMRLHREIDRAVEGQLDWGDSTVVNAVLGRPIAVIEPVTASMLAHRLRERRIIIRLLMVAIGLVAAICLAGCGGGSATADEIAQADADRFAFQAVIDKTTQPVNCAGSVACR